MAEVIAGYVGIDEVEYRRRIRAWVLYDWANSAFATTILAAVLPVYYSQVAGKTLSSPAVATAYWTTTLSISLVIVAILSPILGTWSDIRRGKKKGLAVAIGLGVLGTGLLVFVGTGDWMLASIFFILGRVGFAAANVFYEALLPHVARPEDLDVVSTRGYAIGYLGGGLLLLVNVIMIFVLGSETGARLSFVSVAIWWAVFSIPILRRVPEPPAATIADRSIPVVRATFARLGETFRNIRRYRELFKFLIAFLIYNDGINTIIGVAAIYGAELGFGALELILAILLVQFVGIPFSLMFGRIPNRTDRRAPVYLAFVVWNLVVLPLAGVVGRQVLPADVVGAPPPPYAATATAVGEGEYAVTDPAIRLEGAWQIQEPEVLGRGADDAYAFTDEIGAVYELAFNGDRVEVTVAEGPDHGIALVLVDGQTLMDEGEPVTIDGYNRAERFGVDVVIEVDEPGEHVLQITNSSVRNEASAGHVFGIDGAEVLPPRRVASLGMVLGLLLLLELIGIGFAATIGRRLVAPLVRVIDTKRTVILALVVYTVIAAWGFFLDTVIEFWFLAWLVAVVQGGSQALSRSLYAAMTPTAESGEFFGFFSVMSKFSAIFGPIVFAGAVAVFGSSRPAILLIVVFFVVGGYLLSKVDVAEGRRVALEADQALAAARVVEADGDDVGDGRADAGPEETGP